MSLSILTDDFASATIMGLVWFCAALLVQGFALWWLNPQKAVGDEKEYLTASFGAETPRLWLRVPLFFSLSWVAARLSHARQVIITRIFVSVISAATVGLAAGFAHSQAGFAAGLTAGLLMILSVERIVIAIHVWPDTLLGLWSLLFLIVMWNADGSTDFAMLGIIAALGFLTRVDFAVLACLGVAFAILYAPTPFLAGLLVAGPTLAVAIALSVRNGLKYGIWLPDTTFSFNMLVSISAIEAPDAVTIELMRKANIKTRTKTRNAPVTGDFFAKILKSPTQFLRLIAQRANILVGQETFVNQKLNEHDQAAYTPRGKPIFGTVTGTNLTYWFLFVFVAFVACTPRMTIGALILTGTLLAIQAIVQTRSRYRMSVFPVICTSIAVSIWRTDAVELPLGYLALSGLAACGILVALLIIRPKREM